MNTLITRVADRLCSHSKAPALRPFTKGDWCGYAGCESDSPEIGSTDDVEVVLDGDSVTASVITDPSTYGGLVYAQQFPSADVARLVALAALADPSQVQALLGEPVGSL